MCDVEHAVLEPLDRRSARRGSISSSRRQIAGEGARFARRSPCRLRSSSRSSCSVHAVERGVRRMRLVQVRRADRRRNAEAVRKRSWFRRVNRATGRAGRPTRSANGTINALHHARHAVRGRHADRQPRRHHRCGRCESCAKSRSSPPKTRAAPRICSRATASRRRRPACTSTTKRRRRPSLVARLSAARAIALVSDAGTPTVSDPGAQLIAAAHRRGHPGRADPGPSAVLAALAASGLADRGVHVPGFPPTRSKDQKRVVRAAAERRRNRRVLRSAASDPATLWTSCSASSAIVDVAVGRELTKVHEELVRGPISEVLSDLDDDRGEFTVVVILVIRPE